LSLILVAAPGGVLLALNLSSALTPKNRGGTQKPTGRHDRKRFHLALLTYNPGMRVALGPAIDAISSIMVISIKNV
jgi:hypothetical protein